MNTPITIWAVPLLFWFLAACGDDGNDNDTIWTGISGVVLVVILGALLLRWFGRRGR